MLDLILASHLTFAVPAGGCTIGDSWCATVVKSCDSVGENDWSCPDATMPSVAVKAATEPSSESLTGMLSELKKSRRK
eukprot:g7114.t1